MRPRAIKDKDARRLAGVLMRFRLEVASRRPETEEERKRFVEKAFKWWNDQAAPAVERLP